MEPTGRREAPPDDRLRVIRDGMPVEKTPDCAALHPGYGWDFDQWPLLRKPIRPALLDTALERRPRVHARQPRAQIRIRSELVEHFCHVADKTHLDVCAGQRVADEKLPALRRAVAMPQMIGDLAVDAR